MAPVDSARTRGLEGPVVPLSPWPEELDARAGSETGSPHRSVMVDEVLDLLRPRQSGLIVDATLGAGGHSAALLAAQLDIAVIGIDRDPQALEIAEQRLAHWADRIELVCADFRMLPQLAFDRSWWPIRGILADLGVSSMQLDDSERGFSFLRSGPLDMRMDPTAGRTAADLVNELDADELTEIFQRYGEERHARRIARAVVSARRESPLRTTDELADLVVDAVPGGYQRIHPATRTFQALRIAVNQELNGLYEFIVGAGRLLAPGGRLVVITFHSLEDRIVKRAFRYLASDCVCPPRLPQCACDKHAEAELLTRGPMRPRAQEVDSNPRSRSAGLRVLERR